jgi:hypothetical protein
MTILDLFGYLLVILAMLLAGYSLRCVCRSRKTGRDPRPFAMPVFSLLAFAMMKACWIVGGFAHSISSSLAIVLLITDYAVVGSIGWLLFHATKRRAYR